MLTTAREYKEIFAHSGLQEAMEARLARAGRQMEAVILRRLIDRLRSDECHGMNRDEIAGWLESMTYSIPGSDEALARHLDLFRTAV